MKETSIYPKIPIDRLLKLWVRKQNFKREGTRFSHMLTSLTHNRQPWEGIQDANSSLSIHLRESWLVYFLGRLFNLINLKILS